MKGPHSLVDIQAIQLICYNLKQKRLLVVTVTGLLLILLMELNAHKRQDSCSPAPRRVTRNECFYEFNFLLVDFDFVLLDEVIKHHVRGVFVTP